MTRTLEPRLGVTAALLVATAAALAGCGGSRASSREPAARLDVSAATSLTRVMPQLAPRARFSFGGSNVLQLQIERGAPADLFLAAGSKEAQALHREGRCERPRTFATNVLVLVVPHDDPGKVRSLERLQRGGLKLSVGNPDVPVGAYTRKLLTRLHRSAVLERNAVSEQENVGQVASQVAFGGADAGFVYATDARAQPERLDVIALPRAAQPPVAYQGCVVRRAGASTRGARELLDALGSPRDRGILRRAGFGLPPRG